METNPMLWGLSHTCGLELGHFYFGGLWITLKYISRAKKPTSCLVPSFIIRVSFVMLGFWVIMRKDLMSFILTLIAFFITRIILTRVLGKEKRGTIHAHQP